MVDTEPCELPKWNDATPLAARAGLGGAAQADHQVGADGVGGRGALGVERGAVGRPRQERLHADRRHPALEPTGQVPQDVRLADRAVGPLHDQAVIAAAAARIDDDPLARQPRARAAHQLLLADRVRRAAGDPRTEKVQGAQRFRAADAVRVQPVLTLVGHQRVVGVQPEVAVDQAGVEPEILQPGLQGGDVVAVHRRAELMVQRAGAEPVRRLLQRTVGRLADDAVDQQPAVLLEGAHRMVEIVVEHVHRDVLAGGQVLVGVVDHAQRRQRSPDLGDRTPAVTATQTRHRRPFGHGCQR